MKRLVALILALMFLTFCACGNDEGMELQVSGGFATDGDASSDAGTTNDSNISVDSSSKNDFTVNDKINEFVDFPEGVSLKMQYADFWIKDGHSEVLMSVDAISKYNCMNDSMFYDENNKVFSLNKIKDEISGQIVLNYMPHEVPEKYNEYYLNGKPTDEEFWNRLILLCNSLAVPETVKVKFGYSVKRSNLRLYPSDEFLAEDATDTTTDLIVSSELMPYQPVCVLHESTDGQWYFCFAYGMSGWVRKDCVAFCSSRSDWNKRQTPENFLVVTGKELRLTEDILMPETSNLLLPMGTRLPLIPSDKAPKEVNGRATYGNYVVKLPVRSENGYITDVYDLIPISSDVSVGYLPYTRENVLRQSFKLLGDRYGWAGMFNANDCSGIVHEVFACFGFNLPRTAAGQQSFLDLKRVSVSGLSINEKKAVLDDTPAGTLLYFSGHIMIYLGSFDGEYYVLSSTGGFTNVNADENRVVMSVVVNPLSVKKKNEKTWLELLSAIQYMTK